MLKLCEVGWPQFFGATWRVDRNRIKWRSALQDLKVELFTDGAEKSEIVEMAKKCLDTRLYNQSVPNEVGAGH